MTKDDNIVKTNITRYEGTNDNAHSPIAFVKSFENVYPHFKIFRKMFQILFQQNEDKK